MKCPLFVLHVLKEPGKVDLEKLNCIQADCAWWEPKIGKCAVLRIWQALQDIHEILHDIEARMPHEGQFRR